jgi:hypothetical protein
MGTTALAIVVLIVTVVGFSTGLIPSNPQPSSAQRPTPDHLVVGQKYVLPRTLYLANPVGSRALVTPTEAFQVETTMWQLWQKALVSDDTRALTQLLTPGPMLTAQLYYCTWPHGGCANTSAPQPMAMATPVVPVQTRYPIDFLAEVQTTGLLGPPVSKDGPLVEVQVLTKASPAAPWKLSLDTSYSSATAQPPQNLPFATVAIPQDDPVQNGQFNPAPTQSGPAPSTEYLSLLAGYWQEWKEDIRPSSPYIDPNGVAAHIGESFAQDPESAVFAGSRTSYLYAADHHTPQWTFTSPGGVPFVCGIVSVRATAISAGGSVLLQNPDRTNWGMQLVPGDYPFVTTTGIHQVCVFQKGNLLDAISSEDSDPVSISG